MKMKIKLVSISFILFGTGASWATADDNAIIKNKSLDTQRKELDISVYVTKVNDLDLEEDQEEIEVTAGERTLDIECIVRSLVGMGMLDLGKSTRMNVKLEAGRTYQLGAKLTKEGECTPTLQ